MRNRIRSRMHRRMGHFPSHTHVLARLYPDGHVEFKMKKKMVDRMPRTGRYEGTTFSIVKKKKIINK